MSGEIVLGYDGSEGAKAALPEAVALARALSTRLVITFGYDPNPVGGMVGDFARALRELGEKVTDGAKSTARQIDPDLDVEVALVADRPAESLIDVALERGARMIVVGGNGRGPIAGTLLGSVTYRVLHRAPVPVLVIQPPDARG